MAKITHVGTRFNTRKVYGEYTMAFVSDYIVEYDTGTTRTYKIERLPKKAVAWMEENAPESMEYYNEEMREYNKATNPFGMEACMESVAYHVEAFGEDPFEMLAEYEQRAKEDVLFNKTMIDAVKQYIADHNLTKEEEKPMTREERREAKREIRNMRHDVIEAYNGTENPTETIELLVTERGYKGACEAVATVVNMVSLHDGRIYDKTREWAQNVEGAYSNEVCRDLGFYGVDSWIHSAHVDQIGDAMRKYEPKTEHQTVDTCDLIHEIKSELEDDAPIDIGCICDYDDSAYVSDAFAEIADSNTSIYYSDIIKYISEHVEAVNDAIEEMGWEGCGSDLYKAGQMAEYIGINSWLWSHDLDIYKVYALNYYRFNYGERLRRSTWEQINEAIEEYYSDIQIDTLGEIKKIVDEVIHDMCEALAERKKA